MCIGYWRLVNLGILHRDISDGNVMMLRGDQRHARRLSDEERTIDVEELRKQYGAMAESEAMLRQYLNKLERPSSGMLSDFDLHTTHFDGVARAHGSNNGADFESKLDSHSHAATIDAQSKRRKTVTGGSVSITPSGDVKGKTRQSILLGGRNSRCTPKFDEGRPLVDFRTVRAQFYLTSFTASNPFSIDQGTPTFMSVRVLATKPGAPSDHNFMDDLESFFWLILWSVAAHLDPDQDPTPAAQKTIGLLEQVDLEQMLVNKTFLLAECTDDGMEIKGRLLQFENQWATNNKVSSLIHSMGKFFYKARYREDNPINGFPTVVDMIYAALNEDSPE